MNFWTFLDRNMMPLIIFIFIPLLFLSAIGGPSLIRAFREPPKCEEVKP